MPTAASPRIGDEASSREPVGTRVTIDNLKGAPPRIVNPQDASPGLHIHGRG